ncbi:Hsp20/alpha crystallin family protein [Synechococcus sp. FGCU-3]|jgi:HSP20 family protein|nr:Hsp20/alpha crystallin family protein [Synechococcus sp. FGCU3]
MAITRWEPLRDIEQLFDRYSRSLGFPFSRSADLLSDGEWCPRVDIGENDKAFLIKAELPGVRKDDVKVLFDHGVLTIEGERHEEREEKGWRFHRMERSSGCFLRSFTLPSNVDSAALKAHFQDGMLDVEIPKTAAAPTTAVAVPVD